jgi:hypothetical protein
MGCIAGMFLNLSQFKLDLSYHANVKSADKKRERIIRYQTFLLGQVFAHISMLGGSLVTTAWRVLRLRMEGTPSRYGG